MNNALLCPFGRALLRQAPAMLLLGCLGSLTSGCAGDDVRYTSALADSSISGKTGSGISSER